MVVSRLQWKDTIIRERARERQRERESVCVCECECALCVVAKTLKASKSKNGSPDPFHCKTAALQGNRNTGQDYYRAAAVAAVAAVQL
jgi:hypothetical protein